MFSKNKQRKSKDSNSNSGKPLSQNEDETNSKPLGFVDLSKFDGDDDGYLYWMKGTANGAASSVPGVARAHQPSGNSACALVQTGGRNSASALVQTSKSYENVIAQHTHSRASIVPRSRAV